MPAIADPTELRRVALFRDLSLPQLAVLNGLMRRHSLPAGARILMTDQLEDTAYVVQSGLVKIVVEQADGGELILAILGPGDVIGALTMLPPLNVPLSLLSVASLTPGSYGPVSAPLVPVLLP